MKKLILTSLLILGLINLSIAKNTFKTIKYSKIKAELKMTKNLSFSKEALYHLALFGKKAEYKMWFILDKSDLNSPVYDLAYCDMDCDGLVGEEGEKFKFNQTSMGNNFTMKDWLNPSTQEKSDIRLYKTKTLDGKSLPMANIMIPILGEYTSCDLISKSSPEEASKVWIGYEKELYVMDDNTQNLENIFYRGDGQIKNHPRKIPLHKQTFNVGYPGTNGSKWVIGETSLPKGEYLKATIDYKTKSGKKKSSFSKLSERC